MERRALQKWQEQPQKSPSRRLAMKDQSGEFYTEFFHRMMPLPHPCEYASKLG